MKQIHDQQRDRICNAATMKAFALNSFLFLSTTADSNAFFIPPAYSALEPREQQLRLLIGSGDKLRVASGTEINYSSSDDLTELPPFFQSLDLNDDGKINFLDLQIVLDRVWKSLDLNGDGEVDLDELAEALEAPTVVVDVDRDGDIDAEELHAAL